MKLVFSLLAQVITLILYLEIMIFGQVFFLVVSHLKVYLHFLYLWKKSKSFSEIFFRKIAWYDHLLGTITKPHQTWVLRYIDKESP